MASSTSTFRVSEVDPHAFALGEHTTPGEDSPGPNGWPMTVPPGPRTVNGPSGYAVPAHGAATTRTVYEGQEQTFGGWTQFVPRWQRPGLTDPVPGVGPITYVKDGIDSGS